MKVLFIKSGAGHGYGYFAGAVADLPDETAATLIAAGVCAVDETGPVGCALPLDIPHRDKLEIAGIIGIEELTGDLTAIKGIGEKSAKEITAYLAKVK